MNEPIVVLLNLPSLGGPVGDSLSESGQPVAAPSDEKGRSRKVSYSGIVKSPSATFNRSSTFSTQPLAAIRNETTPSVTAEVSKTGS